MLTVKKLQDAKKELLKHGGAIYVVQSAGKVEVWKIVPDTVRYLWELI